MAQADARLLMDPHIPFIRAPMAKALGHCQEQIPRLGYQRACLEETDNPAHTILSQLGMVIFDVVEARVAPACPAVRQETGDEAPSQISSVSAEAIAS